MNTLSILIADDDPKFRQLVSVNLAKRNYLTCEVPDGTQAIAYLENQTPDLAILDLVMPGMSGIEVCAWMRQQGLDIPIMILSAYDEEELKVRALDAGADDYVTKPFQTEEFLARLRALMRRVITVPETSRIEERIQIERLMIDPPARRAFVDDVDMHLTRTEFAVLVTLAKNCDAVLSHDELLTKVWGDEYCGVNHYLHVYVGRIRKKLGDKYSPLLETATCFGYMLHSSLPH